ncbi:TRAM domain-containing protein [Gordonia sp. ABSL1-1]|uniref:class I SAM-dependent RNA methyltransferase n=1 Tax=Gordonia sp. ABSL1-1 TaxID=3053923 RepID=UPI0025731998|nr:TRAM domain-containing protein [Gordonia sp. ABSL1-1]MDL9936400.1 TRAM domain-containing protein [Gordonia sp. ABSL1-1]
MTGIELDLLLERPANGGDSVAHTDGRVVFVRGAIPGERVRARVTDDANASFWRAETVEVLEASPYRVPVLCAAADHGAGCCDLAFVAPAHARVLKRDVLRDVLLRVGRVPDELIANTALVHTGIESVGADTGWRVRTRLAVGDDGRTGQRAFRGSSIITWPCAQPSAGLLDDLDGLGTPGSELAVVEDADGRRHVVELAAVDSRGRGRPGAQRTRHRRTTSRRAERVVAGAAAARHAVGTRVWEIPVTGFWQAHRGAPEAYSQAVTDLIAATLADLGRPAVAWDLYGGAGVFAAALLDRAGVGAVHLVESDTRALAAADTAFGADEPVHRHHGEVARLVGGLPAPDVVVLDPPRTGAGSKVINAVCAAAPSVVVHVGCDAARFARDLGLYRDHGYRPVEIRGFDAFPLTHHVEAIAALVPADTGRRG